MFEQKVLSACNVYCQGGVVKAIFESCPDNFLAYTGLRIYRKHLTISPGIIFFRKRFLMGLYRGGLIYGRGGLIHG